jgi:hypothetical protein
VLALSVCSFLAIAQGEKQDPAKRFEALVQRLETKQAEYDKAAKEAKTEEERMALKRPGAEFVLDFRDIAEAAKGTDTAPKAWMKVLELGVNFNNIAPAKRAFEVLLADYVQTADLTPVLGYLGRLVDPAKVEESLRTLIDKSPHKTVQAAAMMQLASKLVDDQDAARQKEGRALFDRLIANYADVKMPYGKQTYKDAAEGQLFALDNLQIGKPAPDFEVVDENGAKFKLSDYRGKVVVIDFWGIW